MKFTPISRAASSMARMSGSGSPQDALIIEMGVTETRLLTIGMPSSASICSPTCTRLPARWHMRSYRRVRSFWASSQIMSNSDMPMVMVRISSFCSRIMDTVESISPVFSMA